MIRIIVLTHNGQFASLEVKGHADSAPKGEDLVCSAVSAIVLGGLNSLTDPEGTYVSDVKEGHVTLKALHSVSQHDAIALETIVKQLESVAKDYSSYAKLERKEA